MKEIIRNRLMTAALAMITGAAGVITHQAQQPSAEVLLAMELGAHFESSGRHIGTPYVDKLGKGQPLTVCNGVTGSDVVAGRYYSPADCKKIELPKYRDAERTARGALVHWREYNPWVRASFIDLAYNVPSAFKVGTSITRLANAGNLPGACQQMPQWVYGTVNGVKTRLGGLVDRRNTTHELCSEWGRDGHFSAGLLARADK